MRRGDVGRRSPPQSRFRYRDNSPPRRSDCSVGSAGRVYDDIDRDRDVQSRRLSEFNESLGRNESTTMKFHWNQLLGKPKNGNPSLDHPNGGYEFSRGGTSRNYRDLQYSDANQKNYGDDIYPYKSTSSNLRSYGDGRYPEKDQKNYDGVRYSDMKQKGYEGSRYSDMNVRSYEDARYSDKGQKKSYEGTRYSDINLKSYEDARYLNKGQKNYDGVRYSDMKQKSYEDARYSDKDEKTYEGARFSEIKHKSYENARYSDTNPKSYEDARYPDKDQKGYEGFRYSDISTKSYEDTRYSDKNHRSYEDLRAKSYSFYSPDVGVSKVSTGNLGDGYKLPSRNLKSGFHEDDPYNSSRLQPCSEKVLVDVSPVRKYKSPVSEYCNKHEERNSSGYSKDFLDCSRVTFSGSKATGKTPLGLLEEDSLGGGKSYSELYEKRDLDYSYQIPKDDEIVDYKEFHATMPTYGDKYSRQDSLSTSVVDPIVERLEEGSHREEFYDSGLDIPNYLEVARARKQEREVLGFDITNGEYKTAVYEDHGSVLSGESDDFEQDGDYWTHEDSYKNLLMEENNSFLDEMGSASLRTILKRKRGEDNESNMLKFGSKSSRRFGDDSFAAEKRTDEARKLIFSSNKSKSLKNRLGPCPNKRHDPHSSLRTNKSSLKKRLGPRVDDSYQDSKLRSKSLLKKRLGPHPNKFGSSLENEKSLLKGRLGPKPQNNNKATLPWLNLEKFNRQKKLTRKNKNQIDDAGKKNQIDDIEDKGDQTKGNSTNEKAEPREDSEEFMLMVEHAFFRYVKQLNENSEQRRRFTEQGENAKLKCSVCGSNSKEYLNAESLAVHAFKSSKVRFRSQHLGYHKAICTLMGWKSEVGSQRPWLRENLSDDEALLLKEDLIIWPPVVIIHNNSLESKSSDEHIKVSVEVLESILKEKGYAGKTKICVGQSANESIMLVKFNATFSGLQEALRLHSYYAELKHGKSDLFHSDPAGQPLEKLPESLLESVPGSMPPPSPLPPLKCKIEDMPGSMTESVPGPMTESMTGPMVESVPGSMMELVPGSMTESTVESVPVSMPESVPESTTKSVPGSMTESVPESMPESVQGSMLESVQESVSGSMPPSSPPPPLERKIENILHGHLGLAEDLDKLDPETKKRCLVKSKKEIQSIAEASLKKESRKGKMVKNIQ